MQRKTTPLSFPRQFIAIHKINISENGMNVNLALTPRPIRRDKLDRCDWIARNRQKIVIGSWNVMTLRQYGKLENVKRKINVLNINISSEEVKK